MLNFFFLKRTYNFGYILFTLGIRSNVITRNATQVRLFQKNTKFANNKMSTFAS